jgi:hypothetical protein
MLIKSISEFRAATRQGSYAWPGGYPLYFVTSDGAALSPAGAKANRRDILEALRDGDTRSGFHVCALEINWEDRDLVCDATNEPIPAAYGDDDSDDE